MKTTIFLILTISLIVSGCSTRKQLTKSNNEKNNYQLSETLKLDGYTVLYQSKNKDVVILRKPSNKKLKVGELALFKVVLQKDSTELYNVTVKPINRNDSDTQYHNRSKIWVSGDSTFDVGVCPASNSTNKPTACTARGFQLIIGQSDTRNVSWKPTYWKNIEEYEFSYFVQWRN